MQLCIFVGVKIWNVGQCLETVVDNFAVHTVSVLNADILFSVDGSLRVLFNLSLSKHEC